MPGLKDIPGPHRFAIRQDPMTGATADDETTIFVAPGNMTILAVNYVPDAAITANATNYTTVNIVDRGAVDGQDQVIATRSFAATADSALEVDATLALSGTPANLQINAGDVITVQRAHSGTGLALPGALVEVLAEYR